MTGSSRRRWLRISLRTLLIVVTIACVWLAVFFNGVRRQAKAVKAIEDAGGQIVFDYQFDAGTKDVPPPGPPWLRRIVGDDAFRTPVHADIFGDQITDAFLEEHTGGLSEVEVVLIGSRQVTDAGIVHVARLRKVDGLALYTPQITDAALVHIGQMEQLTSLLIDCPQVTDSGVRHLTLLHNLQSLTLHYPKLTPAGVRQLSELNNVRYVFSLRDPRNEATLNVLNKNGFIDCFQMPLIDMIDYFSHYTEITIDARQIPAELREQTITAANTNASCSEVLEMILQPAELGYYFEAGTIVIAPREKAEKKRAGYRAFRETFPNAEQLLVDW